MKKKIAVIAVQEYHKTTNLVVETDADIDVKEALEKAKKWVRENITYPCTLSEIPNEALESAGLKVLTADFIFCGEEDLVTTEANKRGIHFATCRDCGEFDSGVCLKYGGQCDPDADVGTCFFGGDNAVRLCYNSKPFGPIIILDEDYFEDGIKEIMRLLDIKPEDYGIEVTDEELLSIKEDSSL